MSEVEEFIRQQEELVFTIASGLKRSTAIEEVAQVVYGAYLVIEVAKARSGHSPAAPGEAIERARTRTSDLMQELEQ